MLRYNAAKMTWIVIIILLILPGMTLAGDLFIDPASPLVEVGGQITLSVTNASGDVMWSSFKGQIQGAGSSVTYLAPDIPVVDMLSALDSAGNSGTATVVVQEKADINEIFSRENANWEIYTNRSRIQALLLSDDKTTLWVGTEGGLEERNALNGVLKRVYTQQSGLPDNDVRALHSDDQGGIWVGTGF